MKMFEVVKTWIHPPTDLELELTLFDATSHPQNLKYRKFFLDVHYAIYARNPSPELKHIIAQERNVHLFTPTTVVNQA